MVLRRWAAAAVLALGLGLLVAGPAEGGQPGPVAVVPPVVVVWGAPCSVPGETAVTKGGRTLVCVQRPVDVCPRWHDPAPGRPGSGWVRPSTSPCLVCSPSPAAPVPSPVSSTPPASTPVVPPVPVGVLPVTG